jgi:hypothetical protein
LPEKVRYLERRWFRWHGKDNVHLIEVVKPSTWVVELGIVIWMVTKRLVMEIFTFVKNPIS